MLERLLISKVRIKILKQYLLNMDQEYHVRGLVRILDEEINAVRRELKNLEAFGLLIPENQTNKLVYKLNHSNPFIHELRALIYKDTPEFQHIIKVLSKIELIENALVTEAFLKKEYSNDQDIDILIIGKPDIRNLTKELHEVEEKLGRELKLAVISKDDFEFRKKKRDTFLLNIMDKDKILLIGSPNNIGL